MNTLFRFFVWRLLKSNYFDQSNINYCFITSTWAKWQLVCNNDRIVNWKLLHGAFQNKSQINLQLIELYHHPRLPAHMWEKCTVHPVCVVHTARILYTIPRQRSQWQHAAQITLTWSQPVRLQSGLNKSEFFLVNRKCQNRKTGEWRETLDSWESKYESGCMPPMLWLSTSQYQTPVRRPPWQYKSDHYYL